MVFIMGLRWNQGGVYVLTEESTTVNARAVMR